MGKVQQAFKRAAAMQVSKARTDGRQDNAHEQPKGSDLIREIAKKSGTKIHGAALKGQSKGPEPGGP